VEPVLNSPRTAKKFPDARKILLRIEVAGRSGFAKWSRLIWRD
jgi:hypothetical protein